MQQTKESKELPKSIRLQIDSGTINIKPQLLIEVITKELEDIINQHDSVGY